MRNLYALPQSHIVTNYSQSPLSSIWHSYVVFNTKCITRTIPHISHNRSFPSSKVSLKVFPFILAIVPDGDDNYYRNSRQCKLRSLFWRNFYPRWPSLWYCFRDALQKFPSSLEFWTRYGQRGDYFLGNLHESPPDEQLPGDPTDSITSLIPRLTARKMWMNAPL